MDKNTITGLVLIGILLVGFSYLSRPSKEQQEAWQRYNDSIALVQQHEADLKAKAEAALAHEKAEAANDSTGLFFPARQGADELICIQNDLAQLSINTRGGSIAKVVLKEYMEQDKSTPVRLFENNDVRLNFLFYNQRETIQTEAYHFIPVNRSDSAVTMRLAANTESYIDFTYTLHPGSYLVDFTIQAVGMEGKLATSKQSVDIEWSQRARQIEKGYTYENRLAELTYRRSDESVKSLSAAKDDKQEIEGDAQWIAFKNQFFSAVMLTDAGFQQGKLTSKMEPKDSGYIKHYSAEMSTPFDPTGREESHLYFYFGPNHYKTLSALDDGTHADWELNRLVYLGWPLLRWINKWFTINIFDWLTGWGLSMGVVLLLMTLIVKIVIYPTTWKT